MSKIDNSFSVNFLKKFTCPLQQNSLDQQQDPLVPGYRTRLSLQADKEWWSGTLSAAFKAP